MAKLRISLFRMAERLNRRNIKTILITVACLLTCNCYLHAQNPTELTTMSDTITQFNNVQLEFPKVKLLSRPTISKPADQTQKNINNKKTDTKKKSDTPVSKPAVKPVKTGQTTLIYLERTDVMTFDEEILPDIQVLVGNVLLRHDDAYLYCDSAHLNRNTNSFEAFGNVRIEQGDSIFVYSKKLRYDGNSRIAKLFQDVRMLNEEVTLTTDTLTYDRNRNLGFYTCGGTIRDSLNTLVSKNGYYYTDSKLAEFKYNVIGRNSNSTIESDTLTYNTSTKVATILGPTLITNTDSSTIYSEYGWYNSENDKSELLKNSLITHSDGKTLSGDTIFYDKAAGIGEAFGNVEIADSMNLITFKGHYGYYKEQNDECLMTDSAMMMEYSQNDTMFIHADTLYSYSVDEESKIICFYRHARLFHPDFQGVCDSMTYYTGDSIMHLMQLPVLWNDNQQITGDTIHAYPKNGTIDRIHIVENAIIIQEEDTVHYNQMAGKEIIGYIKDRKLDYMEILGNAESIFYPTDNGSIIGLNKITSSYMTIYFYNGKLDRLKVYPSPSANMYPLEQVQDNMLHLSNYTWQIDTRPTSKTDIFRHPKRLSKQDIDAQKQILREQEQQERKKQRDKRNKEVSDKL